MSESWKFNTNRHVTNVSLVTRNYNLSRSLHVAKNDITSFMCINSLLLQECRRDTAFPTVMAAEILDQTLSSSFQIEN